MTISPEYITYAITALATAASAYGALKARLSAVEHRLDRLDSSIRSLHEKIQPRPLPPPDNLRVTDPSLR